MGEIAARLGRPRRGSRPTTRAPSGRQAIIDEVVAGVERVPARGDRYVAEAGSRLAIRGRVAGPARRHRRDRRQGPRDLPDHRRRALPFDDRAVAREIARREASP
jgi:hypothetical protein